MDQSNNLLQGNCEMSQLSHHHAQWPDTMPDGLDRELEHALRNAELRPSILQLSEEVTQSCDGRVYDYLMTTGDTRVELLDTKFYPDLVVMNDRMHGVLVAKGSLLPQGAFLVKSTDISQKSTYVPWRMVMQMPLGLSISKVLRDENAQTHPQPTSRLSGLRSVLDADEPSELRSASRTHSLKDASRSWYVCAV